MASGVEVNLAGDKPEEWHRFILHGSGDADQAETLAHVAHLVDVGKWLPLTPWDEYGTPTRMMLVNPAHIRAVRIAHPETGADDG